MLSINYTQTIHFENKKKKHTCYFNEIERKESKQKKLNKSTSSNELFLL